MFDNPFEFVPDFNFDGKHDIYDAIIAGIIFEEIDKENSDSAEDDEEED